MLEDVKDILQEALQLGDQVEGFTADTPLLGNLPELDSMAVVTILTLMEERFDVVFADDEISADAFESVGTLTGLLRDKLA